MIICGNCGAINEESEGRFCRKCGALLPMSSKSPRIKVPQIDSLDIEKKEKPLSENESDSNSKNQVKPQINQIRGESQIFASIKKQDIDSNKMDLQEIPQPRNLDSKQKNGTEHPKIEMIEDSNKNLSTIPTKSNTQEEKREQYLKEIAPKPFEGSIITSKRIYRNTISKESTQKNNITTKERENVKDRSIEKQKQLENDMLDVLAVISSKLEIAQEEPLKSQPSKLKVDSKKIPPSSMNEILSDLVNLDQYIEASALIKEDGTVLASALSSRISDSLFATIGQNLSMIGKDIIQGLSAGKLNSISIRGTEGILDIAPLYKKIPQLKNMILLIFSNSRVKSGIIYLALNIVKKQIKEYLGIKK
jgi:predicted regulator of Ras-like GTPase activity (Roadblock/LC7/MglB family)/ribosomal protein L40E